MPLEVRQIENNKWQAVPSAAVNATRTLLAPGFAELAIECKGETQAERDDPQSKKMVAAASTEIAGSIMGVISSCLAASFKKTEQPEVGAVMLIMQAFDFSCSVSGIGCGKLTSLLYTFASLLYSTTAPPMKRYD